MYSSWRHTCTASVKTNNLTSIFFCAKFLWIQWNFGPQKISHYSWCVFCVCLDGSKTTATGWRAKTRACSSYGRRKNWWTHWRWKVMVNQSLLSFTLSLFLSHFVFMLTVWGRASLSSSKATSCHIWVSILRTWGRYSLRLEFWKYETTSVWKYEYRIRSS